MVQIQLITGVNALISPSPLLLCCDKATGTVDLLTQQQLDSYRQEGGLATLDRDRGVGITAQWDVFPEDLAGQLRPGFVPDLQVS